MELWCDLVRLGVWISSLRGVDLVEGIVEGSTWVFGHKVVNGGYTPED